MSLAECESSGSGKHDYSTPLWLCIVALACLCHICDDSDNRHLSKAQVQTLEQCTRLVTDAGSQDASHEAKIGER